MGKNDIMGKMWRHYGQNVTLWAKWEPLWLLFFRFSPHNLLWLMMHNSYGSHLPHKALTLRAKQPYGKKQKKSKTRAPLACILPIMSWYHGQNESQRKKREKIRAPFFFFSFGSHFPHNVLTSWANESQRGSHFFLFFLWLSFPP